MIQTQTDLQTEIIDFIHLGLEAGEVMRAEWITQEILSNHPNIAGADSDFYTLCAAHHVSSSVRHALNGFKGDPRGTPEQLKLPGYESLQKGYLMERDGERVIVPLKLCTDFELIGKVAEYRKMADGCVKHAIELERYRQDKFGISE